MWGLNRDWPAFEFMAVATENGHCHVSFMEVATGNGHCHVFCGISLLTFKFKAKVKSEIPGTGNSWGSEGVFPNLAGLLHNNRQQQQYGPNRVLTVICYPRGRVPAECWGMLAEGEQSASRALGNVGRVRAECGQRAGRV